MNKRRYTQINEYEAIIIAMREAGKTTRETADELGVRRRQIKWWVSRYSKCQALILAGQTPTAKSRPRKDGQPTKKDIQKELEKLKMENKLLRDFLQSVERM